MGSENTSYYEDVELANGTTITVQGRKGNDKVTLSIDQPGYGSQHTFWLELKDAAEVRDALTAVVLKLQGGVKQG